MGTRHLLIFFVIIVQFCNVLGKRNFYEYYYSRYHKGHTTTTESTVPSTSDIFSSSQYERESTPSDNNSQQNNQHGITDDTSQENHNYEPTVYSMEENDITDSLQIGVIIVIVFSALGVFCCVLCCIRHCCCTKKERRGFIIVNQPQTSRAGAPQQNALIHQPPEFQQSYPTQCFEERSQFFSPQYPPQPMQQCPSMHPQFEHSPPPLLQSHNPPEAPPPYEFSHKY